MLTSLADITSLHDKLEKIKTRMLDNYVGFGEEKHFLKHTTTTAASQNTCCNHVLAKCDTFDKASECQCSTMDSTWTQPHLTASVAPRDCGALCRSVRIKPRFASTRRPTPSEDPVSKASTISIGNGQKKNKMSRWQDGFEDGKKTWKMQNLAESICAMFFFLFPPHNSAHQRWASMPQCRNAGLSGSEWWPRFIEANSKLQTFQRVTVRETSSNGNFHLISRIFRDQLYQFNMIFGVNPSSDFSKQILQEFSLN